MAWSKGLQPLCIVLYQMSWVNHLHWLCHYDCTVNIVLPITMVVEHYIYSIRSLRLCGSMMTKHCAKFKVCGLVTLPPGNCWDCVTDGGPVLTWLNWWSTERDPDVTLGRNVNKNKYIQYWALEWHFSVECPFGIQCCDYWNSQYYLNRTVLFNRLF